ncbi:MAG: phosphotransferase [Anaerolineae bacterium]
MRINPFDRPGQFWRGNLHTHSTESDGMLSPEQVCRVYEDNGYDFLALTDHFLASYGFPVTDTRPYRHAGFTTLIGAELHAGQTELGNLWHILAVGLPLDFAPPAPGEDGPGIAGRALAAGAYVAVAHPAWYTLTERDVVSLGPVDAIETFNGVSVDYNDRADSWYVLDLMAMRGRRYLACATDDAHFQPKRWDAMRGWVWVKSETLTPEAILAALKQGAYYSSCGPEIHDIQVEPKRRVYVRCSPADRVYITGSHYHAASAFGPALYEAEIDIREWGSPYLRVTVRDAMGRRAWSNPIWLE